MIPRLLLSAFFVSTLTWFAAPTLSGAVMGQAQARHQDALNMSVTFTGNLQANGWFIGPVTVQAKADSPETIITHSLNGGLEIRGQEVVLTRSGQYAITWNACKGVVCHDPYTQHIKIASMDDDALSYSPTMRRWSFAGTVVQIRQVHILGMPAEVAKVQSIDYYAWVILRINTQTQTLGEIVVGKASVGDRVRVSISGAHVLHDQVDWNACEPANSPVCRFGELYDDGLLSLDWNIPLSPSNEFIHVGHPNLHWSAGLFWNTEKIDIDDDNTAPRNPPYRRGPGSPCLVLLARDFQAVPGTFSDHEACLPFLVERTISRRIGEVYPG